MAKQATEATRLPRTRTSTDAGTGRLLHPLDPGCPSTAATSCPNASCTRSGSTPSSLIASATDTLHFTAVPPSILTGSLVTLPPGADGPEGPPSLQRSTSPGTTSEEVNVRQRRVGPKRKCGRTSSWLLLRNESGRLVRMAPGAGDAPCDNEERMIRTACFVRPTDPGSTGRLSAPVGDHHPGQRHHAANGTQLVAQALFKRVDTKLSLGGQPYSTIFGSMLRAKRAHRRGVTVDSPMCNPISASGLGSGSRPALSIRPNSSVPISKCAPERSNVAVKEVQQPPQ